MSTGSRPPGKYFEEFQLGEEATSAGRTVTETDIVNFAGLSGDFNQLHTDAHFAQETVFGQRIAHGLLGLSMASGLFVRLGYLEGTVKAFMGLEWKFRKPILIGDTIKVHTRITRLEAKPKLGGGLVFFDAAVINQKGETVQRGELVMLMASREEVG
ncbi:MAG: MaoC/PaaZ C-terminal domain-containing protein [Anaerolineae bacterium]